MVLFDEIFKIKSHLIPYYQMKAIFKEWKTRLYFTLLLFILFVTFNYTLELDELFLSGFYVIILFGVTFSIGEATFVNQLQKYADPKKERYLILPILLIFLFYLFLILHGSTPFKGSSSLHLFLYLFPTLYFLAFPTKEVTWSDLLMVLLILIPSTLIKFEGNSSLPFDGSGFSSVQKFILIIGAVYSFQHVRKLKDIGFALKGDLSFLKTAILSWLLFVGFIYLMGFIYDFNLSQPFAPLSFSLIILALRELIRIYFGTALVEELFFRGLIQNILSQKIELAKHWRKYWAIGFGLFLIVSLIAGYALSPSLFWFPAIICIGLFVAAYIFEVKKIEAIGTYTALAITSIFFGLVHFHAGSILFVGLASVAGWAYGYTYLKTKNVFYAALVHCLVNASEFLFTLDQLK
jgi:hypothetical protein